MLNFDSQSNQGEGSPSDDVLFHAVQSQTRFEKLHSRFSERPFIEANRFWKHIALVSSYLINALSIAGAFYGTFSVFSYFGAGKELSGVLALILLVIVEAARRKAADTMADRWFMTKRLAVGFLVFNIFLFCISATSSGYGIHKGIADHAPVPPTLVDTVLTDMRQQAITLQSNIDALKKTTWRGKVTTRAQDGIKQFSRQLTELNSAILKRQERLYNDNDLLVKNHTNSIKEAALIAVFTYLLLELAFQGCIWFVSYFDYREYMAKVSQGQKSLKHLMQVKAKEIDPITLAKMVANSKTGGVYSSNFISPIFQQYFADTMETKPLPEMDGIENGLNQLSRASMGEMPKSQIPENDKGEIRKNDEPEIKPKTEIIRVPTDIYIIHIDRVNGKEKRMNITDVRRNISANRSRLKRAKFNRKSHIKKQVDYWLGREAELIRKHRELERLPSC